MKWSVLIVPALVEELGTQLRSLGAQVDSGLHDGFTPYDLVVLDYDAAGPAERERVLSGGPTRLLVVSSGAARADFPSLFGRHVLSNLVASHERVVGEDFLVTARKLLGEPLVGLEPWLGRSHCVERVELQGSGQRHDVVTAAQHFAAAQGAGRRVAECFAEATDELVTNALYDAPMDAAGNARVTDRRELVTLEAGETVQVTFGANGRRLGVSVKDPFGTLRRERVLDYLAKCFARGENQVDAKQGGAGLGLYYAFERLSHFALDLSPGRATEAIGLLDLGHSWREHVSRAKSFNLFVSA